MARMQTPPPTTMNLRTDPTFAWRFERNEALSAVVRGAWQYRVGLDEGLAPSQAMLIYALVQPVPPIQATRAC